ncbi:MAG: hypothetical protein ACI8QS_000941 [Planctomycetota bacterium]
MLPPAPLTMIHLSPRLTSYSLAFLAVGVSASAAPLLRQQAPIVFDNVALGTNTVHVSFGRAVAVVDLDEDGLPDIVTADAGSTNGFYRQLPDNTFEDATGLWNVAPIVEYEWSVIAADFDNDGDEDLFFGNGGTPPAYRVNRPYPNRMLRNDIKTTGGLLDVSAGLGGALDPLTTFGVSGLDYDLDGMLDLFVSDKGFTCRLFHNEGGLFFTDQSTVAGLTRVAEWRHTGAADYDLDGLPDVGVGCGDQRNALYHNEGGGVFRDVAVEAGAAILSDTFGMVFQDYDNDGVMDIYVALYQRIPNGSSPVLLGNGDGTFRNVSGGTGMGGHTDMGHDSGDVDGDGYPDIMMGTGNRTLASFDVLYGVIPNGAGGLKILDISAASRFSSAGQTRQHGQGLSDFDRDGDIDIYCNNGGPEDDPASLQGNFFWRSRGNGNGWTALMIEGVLSNRTGVGVRARARTAEGRDIYRTLQVGRGFSNTPERALNFGIGSDTLIERIELVWPSGIVQLIDDPSMSSYTDVIETGALLRGQPTIGQPFSYDIVGTPGDVAELALSLGTSVTPLEGINGDLLLASPMTILPALPIGPGGLLSLPLSIPNLPGLVGLTLHSQAWIHKPGEQGSLSQLLSFTIQ